MAFVLRQHVRLAAIQSELFPYDQCTMFADDAGSDLCCEAGGGRRIACFEVSCEKGAVEAVMALVVSTTFFTFSAGTKVCS